jgi:RNA polymerase sigma-70 factor (ECF subfamily)
MRFSRPLAARSGAAPVGILLATSFLERWRGNHSAIDPIALGVVLAERLECARGVWPKLASDEVSFAAWIGERTPCDDAIARVRALRVEDLYLCHACAGGQPRALHAFETRFVARVPTYLASVRPTTQLIEATQQDLRIRLLVERRGAMPRIGQYAGTGPLDGWVRVAAVRIALDRLHAETRRSAREIDPDLAGELIAPGVDIELDLVRARHREDFDAAFREALAALPSRDRDLFRLTFVESLTPGRIAKLYEVHRTTAMRWLQAAEKALLAEWRVRAMARLHASEDECDSLLAVLKSGLSITLDAFVSPAEPEFFLAGQLHTRGPIPVFSGEALEGPVPSPTSHAAIRELRRARVRSTQGDSTDATNGKDPHHSHVHPSRRLRSCEPRRSR